eukprot:16449014-Heterocapsa_arctica.AAC.1
MLSQERLRIGSTEPTEAFKFPEIPRTGDADARNLRGPPLEFPETREDILALRISGGEALETDRKPRQIPLQHGAPTPEASPAVRQFKVRRRDEGVVQVPKGRPKHASSPQTFQKPRAPSVAKAPMMPEANPAVRQIKVRSKDESENQVAKGRTKIAKFPLTFRDPIVPS